MSLRAVVARASVYLAVLLAILTSAIVSVLLQDIAPAGQGPARALFPYGGETVGIALTGGALPVAISLLLVAVLRRRPLREASAGPFRSRPYWLSVGLIALLATVMFSLSHELYGGLTLQESWAFWSVIVGAAAGVGYWWLRGRSLPVGYGCAECYVMGTLGMFASDIVRTLSGLAIVPGAVAVWGGGGFHDLVFWFGIYASLAFLGVRLFLPPLTRLSEAALRPDHGPAESHRAAEGAGQGWDIDLRPPAHSRAAFRI